MIPKNITIEIHDDKIKKLLSFRGAFPINNFDYTKYIDWNTGCVPSSTGEHYTVLDVLRVLGNLKRYNFIELMFGIPKQEVLEEQQNKLF